MSDHVKIYNPDNRNITQKQIENMRNLTDVQIADLAKAYPNQARSNAYLVYYLEKESPIEQRFPLGTWQNLHNLRRMGRTDILPYSFTWASKPGITVNKQTAVAAKEHTIDLSEGELSGAEGLKQDEKEAAEIPAQAGEGDELAKAEAELQQAIDEKAHHMIVKKLQKRVDELKNQ